MTLIEAVPYFDAHAYIMECFWEGVHGRNVDAGLNSNYHAVFESSATINTFRVSGTVVIPTFRRAP